MSKYKKAFIAWYKRMFKDEDVINALGAKKCMEMTWEAALSWELKDERKNLESHVIFDISNRYGQIEVLKWIVEQYEQSDGLFVLDCRCFSNEN